MQAINISFQVKNANFKLTQNSLDAAYDFNIVFDISSYHTEHGYSCWEKIFWPAQALYSYRMVRFQVASENISMWRALTGLHSVQKQHPGVQGHISLM